MPPKWEKTVGQRNNEANKLSCIICFLLTPAFILSSVWYICLELTFINLINSFVVSLNEGFPAL